VNQELRDKSLAIKNLRVNSVQVADSKECQQGGGTHLKKQVPSTRTRVLTRDDKKEGAWTER